MWKWKNILWGLLIASIVCGITFLFIVVLFPSWYGAYSYYYWGNAHVLFCFLIVSIGYFISVLTTRRAEKHNGRTIEKITWSHPDKVNFFNITRIFYWTGLWGSVIYFALYYTIGMGRLILEFISIL